MKRLLRNPLARLGAAAAALAVVAVPVGMAVASGGSAAAGPGFYARALKAMKAELRHMSAPGRRGRLPRIARPAPAAGVTQVAYYNWSGYADSSSTAGEFSRVSGSWTVPSVTCTAEHRIESQWVGLDGFSNGTVEQTGTISQCFEGKALYYTWYEMAPSALVSVGSTVQPGDKISASVTRSGTKYTIKLTDATRSGNNVSTTQTCAATTCLDESAEWIIERNYYSTAGYAPLPQFTSTGISSGSETAAGTKGTISSVSPNQIFMIDATDSYYLAEPSALNTAGNEFTDTWENSW